jgi:hypothetical protein
VTFDVALRTAAVIAAVALVGAPYWSVAAQAGIKLAQAAYEAAKARRAVVARTAAAGLIVAAAWGKVPLPSFPTPAVQTVEVVTPSESMQAVVADVAKAMAGMNPVDRAVWAETWTKAAVVVEGDATAKEVAFTDTRALRAYTALALDIAWRRIGGHPSGNADLQAAVEGAYLKAMGAATVAVTKDTRKQYADFARAMAWAGYGKG